ncbi:hypothetical protein FRAAL5879 [Frankia alni ACN14a]|uniref:Uncharacterized protein n=1 Tax=Frankia alni (strain DSM 45986 / CECT 9034 / ACN14a) TaxID=326424 RepID=Q0RDG5_FRAAA|nr:hypothetical protein FRAAL5879 [Frankia alni ACN14a]
MGQSLSREEGVHNLAELHAHPGPTPLVLRRRRGMASQRYHGTWELSHLLIQMRGTYARASRGGWDICVAKPRPRGRPCPALGGTGRAWCTHREVWPQRGARTSLGDGV